MTQSQIWRNSLYVLIVFFKKICLDLEKLTKTIFQGFSQSFQMKEMIKKIPFISPEVPNQGHKKIHSTGTNTQLKSIPQLI